MTDDTSTECATIRSAIHDVAGGLNWYDRRGEFIRECDDDELAFTYSQTVALIPVDLGRMVQAVRFDQPSLHAH